MSKGLLPVGSPRIKGLDSVGAKVFIRSLNVRTHGIDIKDLDITYYVLRYVDRSIKLLITDN